jgi:hypothetical protein
MTRFLGRPRLATFAIFAILAVMHTWPLATDPGHLSRNDNADTVLNEWTIAWVAHQVATSPLHLFDANIFYPERNTLAYSEHLFVPAMTGAPLLWLGASPVLTYNILLLAGLTLTGWSTSLVVWRWTDNWTAGLVSGVLAAFNAHTLTRLPHLQALHAEFLPLALAALDGLLSAPRARPALLLALWFVLQALTSYYLLVFTAVALATGLAARPEDWWGARARRLLPWLLLAGAIAIVCVLPFLLPYRRLGIVRPLDEVSSYSATLRNYLSTPARVHYSTWSARWFGGSAALFPGLSGIVLAAIAALSGTAFSDRRARMALAFGAVGLGLSFGPAIPGYATLYALVTPLQGIRNVARFGYLTIVGVAMLAGFGLAFVARRWPRAPWLPAAMAAAIVAVNVDAFVAPVGYVRAEPVLPLYTRLLKTPGAIVAEFPFYPPDRAFFNAPYLLNATRHWRPLLNGYSGLVPASYEAHYRDLRSFPDEQALTALRNAGVTDVVVHEIELRARIGDDAANAVRISRDLQLVERDGSVSLYRLAAR